MRYTVSIILALSALAVTSTAQATGPRIAYASDAEGDYEIYTIQDDGSDPVRLTNSSDSDGAPAWSPDRTRIVFGSDRFGDANIWIMDAADADGDGNGDNLSQLTTHAAEDSDPRISPDGTRVMFQSRRDDLAAYELYVMDIDGSNVVRLTTSVAADTSGDWSPDSSRIVWVSDGWVWVMDAVDADGDGNGDNAELWITGANGALRWSPDGAEILFAANDGDWDIYLMDAGGVTNPGGANVRQRTFGAADEWGDFAPDGRRIVYADGEGLGGGHNLYTIPTDGSGSATQVTSDGAAGPWVSWAPSVPRVSVGDVTGPPGGSVTVPISVSEMAGWDVVGMALELAYDSSILTPSATDTVVLGDALVDASAWYVEHGETTPGILTIALEGVMHFPRLSGQTGGGGG